MGAPGSLSTLGGTYIYTTTDNWETYSSHPKVVGSEIGNSVQGYSVSLSYSGYVLAVGGPGDNTNIGAVWVFTTADNWTTYSELKIIPVNPGGVTNFGKSVSIATEAGVLAIGGP